MVGASPETEWELEVEKKKDGTKYLTLVPYPLTRAQQRAAEERREQIRQMRVQASRNHRAKVKKEKQEATAALLKTQAAETRAELDRESPASPEE